MLTGRAARWSVRALVAGVALAAGVLTAAGPASADHCTPIEVVVAGDVLGYDVTHCHSSTETDPGGAGGGGGAEPTCDLSGTYDYCIGESACWANVPSALDPSTWPEETRPSPESIYTFQYCNPDPGGLTGWQWYTPDVVSVEELARQAFGSLRTPAFSVGFNPPGRAIVGVETWFWAESAGAGPITGSSALGVVAIGEPTRLEVDPGDGSGVVACPWSTTASDTCSYTYARSSAREAAGPSGLPAYTARARLVYEIRFENNGVPLVVPGLPATLESSWQATSLPVAEVQALVGSDR